MVNEGDGYYQSVRRAARGRPAALYSLNFPFSSPPRYDASDPSKIKSKQEDQKKLLSPSLV